MYYDCTNGIDYRKDYIDKICYGRIVVKSHNVLDMYIICDMKDRYSSEAVHVGRFWLDYPEGEFYDNRGGKKEYKNFKSWLNSIFFYGERLMVFDYFQALEINKEYKKMLKKER